MTDAVAWRRAILARLTSERFDLLVIGGGITGAGIARDASLRGLRTALVEAGDFASGTSSRSSRLVHGGVRYLEHGHLHLVFESSRERRVLLRIAPHLVRPLAFTWPVYRGARVSRARLYAGLALYDALALFRNVAVHQRLSRDALTASEPALLRDNLLGGARYYDAATDDSRLTLANVVAAAEAGSATINHAAVQALVTRDGRASGADVRDAMNGAVFRVHARMIVNCTGPWTHEIQGLEGPDREAPAAIFGAKGAHVAVAAGRIGNHGAVTMLHPEDGRVLFAIPAGRHTIFGTTETPADSGPARVRANRGDVRYLLAAANRFFPAARLSDGDVVAAWAGIRPLAARLVPVKSGRASGTAAIRHAPGAGGGGVVAADTGSVSREHEVTTGVTGVMHVTGGKLTTYRAMAEEVVDVVVTRLGVEPRSAVTSRKPLPGGDEPLDAVREAASRSVPDAEVAGRLARAHGSRWASVWSLVREDPSLGERVHPDLPYVGAEMIHAVERELAMSLGDLLIRRTHVAFATSDNGLGTAPAVAALVAPMLGWDAARVRKELDAYEREVERTFGIHEQTDR